LIDMAHSPEQSDSVLLRGILAGEEAAFVTLYRRWQGPLFRFALHMSGSPSIAEDVTQEVFMTLIRDASRFDPMLGTVSGYLYGIARNQVRRRYERERVWVPLAEPDGTGASTEAVASRNGNHHGGVVAPIDLAREETIATVREAVLSLPVHYREPVVLCDLQEMSYEKAAEVLGCAIGTVRSRLHRARALLAAKLNEFRELPRNAAASHGTIR
jgi:RNA polymerase sigma-70 factor (ECF subfamily)